MVGINGKSMFYEPNYVAATAFFQDASGSIGRLRVRRASDWDFALSGITAQLIYWAEQLSDASLVRANAYSRFRIINPSFPATGSIGREVTLVFDNAIVILPIGTVIAALLPDEIEQQIDAVLNIADLAILFGGYVGMI